MKKYSWLLALVLVTLACQTLAAPALTQSALPPTRRVEPVETAIPANPILTQQSPTIIPTVAPTATEIPAPTATSIPAGAIARKHIEALSVGIGQRIAGTEGERAARDYIVKTFESLGYQPKVQDFSTTYEDEDGNEISIRSANVIAVKPGLLKKEIIVGAHYDSVGDAGRGADDNASGVSVLLEVAEKIRSLDTPYTIRFITFGCEEVDLNGSSAYVGQMSRAEIDNTLAMINLDSVSAGDNTYFYSDEGQKARVRDWALAWAAKHGFDLQTIKNVDLNDEDGYGTSDHFAFQHVGILFGYFEATNWTLGDHDGYTQVDPKFGEAGEIWHTQFDTLDYLDKTFPGRVDAHLNSFVSVLQAILTEYQE
jgi:alkaline phosphatase isozyme conversion protein